MTQTTHTKLKFLILWTILLVSFGLISAYLLVSALGYRIDWKWLHIEKTGIVIIKSQPKDVSIALDATFRAKSTPLVVRDILPGMYDITVTKPQFQNWSSTIQVEPGRVTELDDIVLLRVNPIVEQVTDRDKQLLDDFIRDSTLTISKNEIYLNTKTPRLITRLSRDVGQAIQYSDKKHVIYQVGNEIKMIDLMGQNVQFITQLPSDIQAQIIVVDNGKGILIKQESTYLRLTIS